MRKEGFNNPVIFLSGEQNQLLIDKAMGLGIVDYLQKPITVAGLRKSLLRATEQKQMKIHAA
jgi:response regulator of citrate/malate metabolism